MLLPGEPLGDLREGTFLGWFSVVFPGWLNRWVVAGWGCCVVDRVGGGNGGLVREWA
jgi:hypothetical protein